MSSVATFGDPFSPATQLQWQKAIFSPACPEEILARITAQRKVLERENDLNQVDAITNKHEQARRIAKLCQQDIDSPTPKMQISFK